MAVSYMPSNTVTDNEGILWWVLMMLKKDNFKRHECYSGMKTTLTNYENSVHIFVSALTEWKYSLPVKLLNTLMKLKFNLLKIQHVIKIMELGQYFVFNLQESFSPTENIL